MGASEYGRQKKAQVVICGHTHIAVEKKFEEKNITYYNAGCWTDIPSTYLLINTDGKVNIKFY